MILKKPYAFLIKYYRIIHLALAFLLSVCAYKFLDVVRFFNNYVKNNYVTTVVTDLEKIYTPASLFVLVFFILIFTGSIITLLLHKKKPAKIYILMVIYYLVIFVGLFYVGSVLKSFETQLVASTLARSLRDILMIIYIPQFIFIIFMLLRTIGFSIKKFEFQDERKDFDADTLDNEEFEINVNFEGYKVKQKANRFLRESLYYIKENKFIVICIFIVLSIIIGVYIYNDVHSNYDVTYKMGRTFAFEKMNVTIEDAIVTNLDYKGSVIDDKYYLVLKVNITNDTGHTINLDFNNFKVAIGNDIINPTINYANKFIDFASGDVPTSISHKGNKTFALVYKLTKSQTRKNIKLKIYNGSVYDKDEYVNRRIFVDINPKTISDLSIKGNYLVNDTIIFSDTYLKNTSIKFINYLVDKSYLYKYEVCEKKFLCKEYTDAITVPVQDNRYNNKLVVMGVDYKQDESIDYGDAYTSLSSFAENFVKIQYKVGSDVYTDKSINVTPLKSTNLIAFEVPKNIDNASIIQAIITIRNKEYIVNLKTSN